VSDYGEQAKEYFVKGIAGIPQIPEQKQIYGPNRNPACVSEMMQRDGGDEGERNKGQQ
jgi:hypothetical protein